MRPHYAQLFEVEGAQFSFPSFYDLGRVLSPYIRQEIGYGLMSLSLEAEGQLPPSERMQQALHNTGNMFLLSLGINWQTDPAQLQTLVDAYNTYFAETLGQIPEGVNQAVKVTDDILRRFRDVVEVRAALGEMTELFDLGHGVTYMFRQAHRQGANIEIVHGPRVPVDYGTPVRTSYMGLPGLLTP